MTVNQIANGEGGLSVRNKLNALPPLLGSMLPKWQFAKGAALAGTRNARILCLGDSTVWGYGAGGATFAGNLKAKAWPALLAGLLPAGSHQSFFGNGDMTSTNRYPGADTRINPGSWGLGGGSKIGLGAFPYLATAAATLAFTPPTAFDTIEVYYLTDPGNGVGSYSFTVNVDGGASLGTVDGNQAEAFRKATFTCALGVHTVNCVRVAGNCYIVGIVCYNSAAKEITVINAGMAGGKIADIVAPSSSARLYSPLNSLATIAPDLTIIGLTINDANSATVLATYQSQLTTLITTAKAAGSDVLLVSGNAGNPATRPSQIVQQSYVDAFKAVAANQNVPVADIFALLGDFATVNALGAMVDDIHPNAPGYGMIANLISKPLLAA